MLIAPTIITTAPTTSPMSRNEKIKDKLKLGGRAHHSSRENIAINRQSYVAALNGASQSSGKLDVSDGRDASMSQPHISFEEPGRLSTHSARGAPPAYGEVSHTSLALPPSRLSESSRSDASSGDHGIYAETTTTHTVSTTTTFFRLPRRKKEKHLFPLPVKIPAPEPRPNGIKTPKFLRSRPKSMSPARDSPKVGEPVTAIYAPNLPLPESDSEHPSPLPSPTHSIVALTNAPLGSSAPSVFRKDSLASYRSANSTPSIPMPPPFLGTRGRSSTMGSLKKTLEADNQSPPQAVSPGRTSTSTTGRKSFGDILSLSHRLRHNSEPSNAGNGKTLPGTPGTPASTRSKSNSFQIPREAIVYPERSEGDTPATYLTKLEEAVNRGVIAAILCKGFDDFSKTCLRKYMRGFSYFGDSIDMAVRKMLMEVELPKETQQIDRLLQGFADRYCECNPGIFVSTDEAYFVAFSILLLHSDTHNKNNKRKMQKQDYVKNTQSQVEVSSDILECFYDNVSYTPFIHFEDEVAVNSHRLAAPKAKKGIFKAPSTDNLRGPVDPYALILDQKLEVLRPSLRDVMDTEDTYSCTGTTSSMDADALYQAFHKAGVLQIVSARSRPDAFLSQATISNPAEAQVGLVDIKAAKVGLLWRKDPKKKKARSPWQEWGALLTGSQLYFFRDVAWVRSLISQYEAHQKSGTDATPVIFKPPLVSFQPDALLSMDDAVALLDTGYKKHKHAFLFIKHGGFEEVFLANSEADMNDWIAKLNYAATFRTAGVRMRGFIGANYEGQRPELVRGDSASSARSFHAARDENPINGRQINQQLAGEILAYRRQIMTAKINEANERLATAQKELDNLLRNARHLQICSPIQAKTREALVLAAGRMSAKLKWTRVEIWKTKCHCEVMKMDLEQELGSTSVASVLQESSSMRSTPQKKAPQSLNRQSLSKAEIKMGDGPSSPKSTHSRFSSKTASQAAPNGAKAPEVLPNKLSDGSNGDGRHLSVGSAEQSIAATESSTNLKDQSYSLSAKNPTLNNRPSISSSNLGRNDVESVGHGSRLTTPTPSLDDEERVLREAGILDTERSANGLPRPEASESDHDLTTITSPDAPHKERAGARRSLQRTLRDSQHSPQTPNNLRHRKGKESLTNATPVTTLRRSSQSINEGLARGTGSFTVHGKKASVVTLSMSNEDRMLLRKQARNDEKTTSTEGFHPVLSPKAEEDEESQQGIKQDVVIVESVSGRKDDPVDGPSDAHEDSINDSNPLGNNNPTAKELAENHDLPPDSNERNNTDSSPDHRHSTHGMGLEMLAMHPPTPTPTPLPAPAPDHLPLPARELSRSSSPQAVNA